MNNFLLIQKSILIFLIGFVELFLVTINYKFTQRNRMICSGLSTFIYVYMWAYIILALFENASESFIFISVYALGCGLGDFFALKYDNIIDKYITRIQRRGRKKKRGKFYGKKK